VRTREVPQAAALLAGMERRGPAMNGSTLAPAPWL
jgi:hypothetical protein